MLQTNKNCIKQQLSYTMLQYNKCKQVPPVLSSKGRLIKEPKDFTCEEVAGGHNYILSLI